MESEEQQLQELPPPPPPPIYHAAPLPESETNDHVDAGAEMPNNLPSHSDNLSTPMSQLYLDIAADLGAPLALDSPFDATQNDFLSPIHDAAHDPAPQRPATATSADTFQRAQTMFTDFDGTHYASTIQGDGEQVEHSRPGSSMLMSPPKIDNRVPPPEPGMIFYPAPVPKTLMLPQRLSKAVPAIEQAKRRSYMLAGLPNDNRKSAIWLNKHKSVTDLQMAETEEDMQRVHQRMSNLPPQLRASMYFENPSQVQEVEIKDTSAVATLDDLLDASTIAPVSAFTDHPFTGRSGGKVYKSEHRRTASRGTPPRTERRRSSMLGLRLMSLSSADVLSGSPKVKKKSSRAFSLGTRLDDALEDEDAITGPEIGSGVLPEGQVDGPDGEDDEEEFEEDPDFEMPSDEDDEARIGPPTTLLAELQYRKQAQKQRNKTALSAFPNGMHSTLLEMDAVAQLQKKKRQNARVTLAWEDPNRARTGQHDEDDDDVPLGVILASGKKTKPEEDWDQPMGLIQLRELEDNEPLAARKARLRGSDMFGRRPASHLRSLSGTPMLQVNGDLMPEDDEPEETLAQRIRRLKNQSATQSSDGARPESQNLSEDAFARQDGNSNEPTEELPDEVDEEEETLGQRRARLQREASRQSQMTLPVESATPIASPPQRQSPQPALRASTSMADLLHNVPMGVTRRVSDQKLLSSLPQHSLLKQSEDRKAARNEMMADLRNAHRSPSGGRTLLDMSNVDLSRHGIPSNGYRGGAYNNGFGGVGAVDQSMVELRQSMALIAQQNQMALQMMAAQNQMGGGMPGAANMSMGMGMMVDPRMSMGIGMQPQQQQSPQQQLSPVQQQHMSMMGMMQQQQSPVMYPSAHMSMQSPLAANPYMQMQPTSPFEQQRHVSMGAFGNASTPNLMANGAGNGTSTMLPPPVYQQQQRRNVSMATGLGGGSVAAGVMPLPAAASGMSPPPMRHDDPGFVDVNTQARIDAWRQDVYM